MKQIKLLALVIGLLSTSLANAHRSKFDEKFLVGINAAHVRVNHYTQTPARDYADVNGDGINDKIVYTEYLENYVDIIVYFGTGTYYNSPVLFASHVDRGYPDKPWGFVDVNNDGKADFLTVRGDPSVKLVNVIYLSLGTGLDMEHTVSIDYHPTDAIRFDRHQDVDHGVNAGHSNSFNRSPASNPGGNVDGTSAWQTGPGGGEKGSINHFYQDQQGHTVTEIIHADGTVERNGVTIREGSRKPDSDRGNNAGGEHGGGNGGSGGSNSGGGSGNNGGSHRERPDHECSKC